ncbi:hypothetical protein D4R99_02735 [bacterium]|nr:MAG: hypothetical protein D4R99_02735 [bacterium]
MTDDGRRTGNCVLCTRSRWGGKRSEIFFELRLKKFSDPVSPVFVFANTKTWLRLSIPHETEAVQFLHLHRKFTNKKCQFVN